MPRKKKAKLPAISFGAGSWNHQQKWQACLKQLAQLYAESLQDSLKQMRKDRAISRSTTLADLWEAELDCSSPIMEDDWQAEVSEIIQRMMKERSK